MKQLINLSMILLVVMICFNISLAQIPRTLSYQGVLTDSLGNPKSDGVYTFTFRLYDVASGGGALWTEIKDLQVKRGLFSTTLGDITSFPTTVTFDRPFWIGIEPGSEPELSPRIPFSSVAYSLNSLKSDTAQYARIAPAQLIVDSARIAGIIPDNTITTTKIIDGTIQRADVQSTFKAPYSDTSDYAKAASIGGSAGGDLTGTFPNPTITANAVTTAKIADGSVTGAKIATGQVVKSLNSITDNITISAIGGATIISSGDTIIINAGSGGGGTGIQGVQNTNNTLDIINPNGPTATINVKNAGITSSQIADNAVTTTKILDGTILFEDIGTNAATANQVIKRNAGNTAWIAAPDETGAGLSWNIRGNSGTTAGTNFVGTTDAQAFDIRTNNVLRTRITTKGQIETYNTGQSVFVGEGAGANDDLSNNQNVFVGYQAGFSNTTGNNNIANGYAALFSNTTGNNNNANGMFSLYFNTTGSNNTANGYAALVSNVAGSNATAIGYNAMLNANNTATPFTNYNVAVGYEALRGSTTPSANTGNNNTAIGYQTLWSNTSGSNNTATGLQALYSNTTGNSNTANGMYSLSSNTTGNSNTANGYMSLFSNTTGYQNTANGYAALFSNTIGINNTANGYQSLYANTTGSSNTANGMYSLYANTTGSSNTANGMYSLLSNTTGSLNTANGYQSLFSNTTGNNNTGIGLSALFYTTTGFQNTSVGANSLVSNSTGSYNTAIGYNTGPNSANLFNTTCIGIDATATGSDMVRIGNVFVTSIGGQVGWSTLSDGRFKENVSEDVPGLDFITKLRPVTYHVNREKVNEFTGVMERRSKIATDNNTNEPSMVSNQPPEIVTGFIAQEVEAVAQQLGYNFSGVDKPKNESDYYGLRYAEFVVPLVKAVQEQQKRIQELEAIVAELRKEKQ